MEVLQKRVSVSLVKFAGNATLHSAFGAAPTRGDVLYELERIEHTGGQTSLVVASKVVLQQVREGKEVERVDIHKASP